MDSLKFLILELFKQKHPFPHPQNMLIIAITSKPRLGNVLMPLYVTPSSNKVLSVDGQATPIAVANDSTVSDDAKSVVAQLHNLSDGQIAKRFNVGKATYKAFVDKLSDDAIKNNIRPYIDQCICKALPLIQKAGLRVFVKDEKFKDINLADEVDLAPIFKCRPRFFFTLCSDGNLLYMLKVSDGVQDIMLHQVAVRELSGSTAVFVAGRVLYSFEDIDMQKFRPFFANQRIRVEKRIVDSYMNKFVANCLKSYSVQAYGFQVNKSRIKPLAVLWASRSVFGAGFELKFRYADVLCPYADRKRPVLVTQTADGQYVFDVQMRDFGAERSIFNTLSDMGLDLYGTLLSVKPKADFCDIVRWSTEQRNVLLELGVEVQLTDGADSYVWDSGSIATLVTKNNDWFDLKIEVTVGKFTIPFRRFLNHIAASDNRFVLPDGTIFLIPDEWFEQWCGVVPFFHAHGNTLSIETINGAFLPEFLTAADAEQEPKAEGDAPDTQDLGLPTINLDAYVNATLRPYQSYGARWLTALTQQGRGAILADDMGLGKTLQVISALAYEYKVPYDPANALLRPNDTGLPPSLVVVPVSLMRNWTQELNRFAPQLAVRVLFGAQAQLGEFTLQNSLNIYHVVVTSYGTVRSNADLFSKAKFHYLVMDESQAAKNPSSKLHGALMRLCADHRICLSGTPIENNLLDLWAQMSLTNPGLLGSRNSFESHYRYAIEQHANDTLARRLHNIVRPYILRRAKEQVLTELPSLIVQTVMCDMTEEQKVLYEREKSATRNMLLGVNSSDELPRQGAKRFVVLQALTRLRLLANHPNLCIPDYDGDSGKTDLVMHYIENIAASGHKMLVFSSFVKDLTLISKLLAHRGIQFLMLTGQTTDRQRLVEQFQKSETISVFLISLKAGGVGLNLTSADYVLMLNPWWNPAAEAQAYSRAHRMGQQNNVTVYRFITSGTVEEKIDIMQQRKLKLAGDFVTVDGGEPSLEEIEELIV